MSVVFVAMEPRYPGSLGLYMEGEEVDYCFVVALLAYCNLQGFRSPGISNFGLARVAQVACNYIKGRMNVSVCQYREARSDAEYYECSGWEVVRAPEQADRDLSKLNDIMQDLNRHMPDEQRLNSLSVADYALRVLNSSS